MHMFNAWLPPPVAEQIHLETQAFSEAVRLLQQDCSPPQLSASPYASLKWISVFNNFLKSKSDLVITDVELFITITLDLFLHGGENFYVQARWGSVLYKFLKKFSKKLSLTVHWKPLYGVFLHSIFVRRNSFEGIGLQAAHVHSLSNVIRKCRRFFPRGSAAEIWAEFRPMLEDLSHNASLEAAGFVSLFLPTNSSEELEFFTSEWFADCLGLWDGVPYCQYWNSHWSSLVGRVVRKSVYMPNLNMEQFVPMLFSHFLRSFEVPVGKTSGVFPYQREVTRQLVLAFPSDWSPSVPKNIAKSIVYLLKPNGSTEAHLSCMVDLIEQYYHPSNGGTWTSSLERFLRHIVTFFVKRLAKEDRKLSNSRETENEHIYCLTSKERKTFVETILRLIERGQFSKNSSLSDTAAKASSSLAYIEPNLVLPLSIRSFHTALNSITATHQLEAAIKTLALSARTLLIVSATSLKWPSTLSSNEISVNCRNTLELALFDTLSGLDANDPPKTVATLQFFCSIFSSLEKIEIDGESSSVLSVDWSQWLDEFLGRLFSLLLHLESTNHLVGAVESNKNSPSKSFLVQGGSFYFSTLELLFSRLSKDLFEQGLKKVAKFVHNSTLTGAVAEIGLLCSAVVYASPQQGILDLMKPIMSSVLSSLNDCPATGFSGVPNPQAVFDLKTTLSPALEASIVYQLNLVSLGLMYGGEHVVQCKDLLLKIIAASLDAPSAKVNEAGSHLLSSIIGSAVLYYPLDQYKLYQKYVGLEGIEEWLSTKMESGFDKIQGPTWHLPNADEISFANELLDLHLKNALAELRSICLHDNSKISSSLAGTPAQEKEHLRVVLLRIDGSLCGVRSCLPDFRCNQSRTPDKKIVQPFFISGAVGASVGSVDLREAAAETLHLACNYFLEKWADDNVLLSLIAHSIAAVGNSGSLEYSEWSSLKDSNHFELKSLVEPSTNYITNHYVKGQRRPNWLLIELLLLHNTWRASQSQYNCYRAAQDGTHQSPHYINLLAEDLTKLSLHNYDAIRKVASTSLKRIFKRFPYCIKECMPLLLKSLQDSLAPEHAAMGSCTLLASRPMARYLTEDFGALSKFFLAVLNSAHHGTVKAQNAINELFATFILRFSGLPMDCHQTEASGHSETYAEIVTKIQNFCSNSDTTHWRYNLMAQGMLLLLSANGAYSKGNPDANIQNNIKGHFLLNLKSKFPPLRTMSIGSLLFLLHHSSKKIECSPDLQEGLRPELSATSSCKPLFVSILSQENFGSIVFRNFSVDHQFPDEQMQSRRGIAGRSVGPFDDSAISMLWVPGNIRSWPRTRTIDSTMRGDGFSYKYAKLFKRLIQECDSTTLEAFCGPLKDAASELEERGMQCAAAEAIAGFLHSDMECVSKAWTEWLQSLLQKFLTSSSVESMTEWAACIRFAVTGKGRLGRQPPLTRPMVLRCLLEPVPPTASSNVVLKHFTFLCAAFTEIPPSEESADELVFHQQLLMEALKFARHSAPQVREVVGMAICIAGANLEASNLPAESTKVVVVNPKSTLDETIEWKYFITSETISEAAKCVRDTQKNGSDVSMENVIPTSCNGNSNMNNDDLQEAIRFTEMVLYFLISAMKSGRSVALMNMIIEILWPVLSLQETAHKDLSSLAKVALQFLKFQVFPATHISNAVSALLAAANDSNWHTRVASLSFLQSFMYRHTFQLSLDCLVKIWGEVKKLLSDGQLEVRELASLTLAGLMKGSDERLSKEFYENQLALATSYLSQAKSKRKKRVSVMGTSIIDVHALVLGLSACVQSVPYDMPSWLPKVITTLAQFSNEPSPAVRATVRKCVAEFRRTHADTWAVQKFMFNEEELEILTDTSSSASYFA